jgi:hypothetical protein
MVAAPAVVVADGTSCDGEVYGGYYDEVHVPYGAFCKLVGTTVDGDIELKARASPVAIDIDVDGNVQGEYAKKIVVRDSNVAGNIQAKQTKFMKVAKSFVDGDVQAGYVRTVKVLWSRVYGHIQVDHAMLVRLVANDVGGDIPVDKSLFGYRDSFVNRNEVEGSVGASRLPTPDRERPVPTRDGRSGVLFREHDPGRSP